ncbi:MAG: ABC transporter ATP-binding protein, partial [Anaerolineae bacterium]
MDTVIHTTGLTRTFGARGGGALVRAVDGVDLQVARGETFGLIGPDGAGKTTLLRLLNGLLAPSAGSAEICGYDVQAQSREVHRRVGYMAQQFSLYGDLTVAENMAFFARVFQVPAAEQRLRIPRLLDFARLNAFRSRLAGRLSGGMKKKLALACMLVHQPEVVCLDEPTTGVDPVSRREFWDILTDLRLEQNVTILISTPYMDEAERCHRIGLLYGGRLVAQGTPGQIKALVCGQLLELRPPDWRAARALLGGMPGVREVQTYGDRLHVFVDAAE